MDFTCTSFGVRSTQAYSISFACFSSLQLLCFGCCYSAPIEKSPFYADRTFVWFIEKTPLYAESVFLSQNLA